MPAYLLLLPLLGLGLLEAAAGENAVPETDGLEETYADTDAVNDPLGDALAVLVGDGELERDGAGPLSSTARL